MAQVILLDDMPPTTRQAIREGQSRMVCPKCAGGNAAEVSMTVHLAGGELDAVILFCHRASCGYRAHVLLDKDVVMPRQAVKEDRPMLEDLEPLAGTALQRLYTDRYGDVPTRFKKIKHRDVLIMPVMSPIGATRGYVTRTFDKPKRCMTYKQTAQPWLDWWLTGSLGALYIVEDQISAGKLWLHGKSAVALMGTHMNMDRAEEISDQCDNAALVPVIALDPDANDKAVRIKCKWEYIMPQGYMGLLYLARDPKDLDSDTIRKCF